MVQINSNYLKLKAGYLFPEIARRVKTFSTENPDADLIRLGIGDVTEPLPEACRNAMKIAIDQMGTPEGFHGYGPEQGYFWLREAIAKFDYQEIGCDINADEIFVSDGSKCDSSNILDILGKDNVIAVTDPVYPVYVDSNVMSGRTGEASQFGQYEGLIYIPINAENEFEAQLPKNSVDIIYLCFPNNPTGAVATKEQLSSWVKYAKANNSLILFDAAYEAFIQDDSLPHSIYQIEGAKDCAIEFRSFSKNAGFTGTRCAFTVIPKSLKAHDMNEKKVDIWSLWNRRQSTKFNGVSYIVQKGAEACYSEEGKQQIKSLVAFYMKNAEIIRTKLTVLGYKVYGAQNAPYAWIKTPKGMNSWDFFDVLLKKANVVGTPGSGFGSAGEGYFRLSAFNSRENVDNAMRRIAKLCCALQCELFQIKLVINQNMLKMQYLSSLNETATPVIDRQLERVHKTSPKYKVLLHDDPVNTMDYVAETLRQVLPQLSEQDAIKIMLDAHNSGVGLVIVCDLEPAEFYSETLKSKGLTSTIELED